MKWTVRMVPHSLRALLATVLVGCASDQHQSRAAGPGNPNEFDKVVPGLHSTAKAATVSDVIIIDVLPSVGGNNLTYVPSQLNVGLGTKVAWVSWRGRFKLTFLPPPKSAGQWPFDEQAPVIIPDNDSSTSPPYYAIRTVKAGPLPQGYYHFSVELTVAPGLTAKDYECPPIIIH